MAKYKIFTVSQKEEILQCYHQQGWKATEEKYKLPRASVARWNWLVRHASPDDPCPLARRRLIKAATVEFVKQTHKKNPDWTLEKIRIATCKQKQKISRTTIWHIITGR